MKTSVSLALFLAASAAQEQVAATSDWKSILKVIDGFVIGALATE